MNSALKLAIWESKWRTQSVVAKQAGLSDARLSRIIHGVGPDASDDEKKALAKTLRKSVDHLFPEVAA